MQKNADIRCLSAPAYTVGVSKKYLCAGKDELEVYADDLFRESSTGQIFVEKSVSDYKKVEFEVIRDNAGTCGAVCSMESMDSVGINSGDSIVVIPAQTVSPEKLDKLSTCACKAVSALKVTGNCCVSMAVSRTSDRYFVIGMRPGVSRTSVLATKAMGYPLNRISVQVMLGADFDTGSIPDISGRCSVRMPKWSFDSFELNSNVLDTSMQSTGEVLCTAPDFKAAFMKAIRSIDPSSTLPTLGILTQCSIEELNAKMKYAADDRVFAVYAAVKHGISEEKIYEYSHIDKWFLDAFAELAKTESNITHISSEDEYLSARASGFTDADIVFDGKRQAPSYKASMKRAPYYLTSVFDGSGDEIKDDAPAGKKVLLIGSGPTFVGNAAELDWCLVSTAAALRKRGYYVVLLNNDPSAVSTGTRYCDKLYFEPVTADDASEIADRERPDYAVTQFCGPQAYKMTEMLEKKGIKILGPDSGSMNILSDKVRFNEELDALDIRRRDCCFVTPAALSGHGLRNGIPGQYKDAVRAVRYSL
jgi:carbamoyl-phosphate synthase large subunit